MKQARDFMGAYGNLGGGLQVRLLSNMDVNMVMHVHRKHCDTRPSFKSLLHIVANMYDEAQTASKEQGRSLPDWPVVAALTRKSPSSLAENSGIRELDLDGRITDQHFAQAGFGPNIVVVKKEKETDSGTPSPYTIATCSGQEVTLLMVGGDGTKTLEVTRAELISCWAVKRQKLTEVSPSSTSSSSYASQTSVSFAYSSS